MDDLKHHRPIIVDTLARGLVSCQLQPTIVPKGLTHKRQLSETWEFQEWIDRRSNFIKISETKAIPNYQNSIACFVFFFSFAANVQLCIKTAGKYDCQCINRIS